MTFERERAAIAEYGRRLWERRLVSGTSGNLSVKTESGELLVTPAGRSLGSLQPADVVCVERDGTIADTHARATSELPLHVAAYRVRSDVRCVIHTHPTYCVVWSLAGAVFPRETVGSRETLGPVAWTPYFPSGTRELADACGSQFAGGNNVVLMARHGLSAVGPDLETAFVLTDQAEEAARVAYLAAIGGSERLVGGFTGAWQREVH